MRSDESQFIPQVSLVFAHPLLKNASINLSKALDIPPTDDGEDKKEHEMGTSEVENSVEFLDPLGVSSSQLKSEVDMTKLDLKSSLPTKEDSEARLDNTLAEKKEDLIPKLDPVLAGFRPWSEIRIIILEHFKTTESLTLETSFLEPVNSKTPPRQPRPSLKDKTSTSNMTKLVDLTQEEYEKRLSNLRKLLLHFWNHGKRVECIKLITEVARILQSTVTPHFYPAQFVLITDFLDLFGNLVYERLLSKAKQERLDAGLAPLPTYFVIHDVLEQTRITTRNWFGKVQAITELVPRIYIEAALLKCMKFMDEFSIFDNVMRLCAMAQKVQHPLISAYARCYICRIGMRLNPADRAPHWKCLNDWMQTYTQQPVSLIWPALEYTIQCVSYNSVTYNDLSPLWEYCKIPEKRPIILKSMLYGVPPLYLGEHAMEACKLVTSSEIVTSDELCAFGKNLNKVEVPENVRKPILRAIWKCISRLTSLKGYMACCDVWVEFAAKYFTVNELHIILEAIIQKLSPEKKFEAHYDYLVLILQKIVDTTTVISQILNMEIFPHFLDIFQEENVRRKSAALILSAFVIGICKRLHDSMSAYSPESEIEEVSFLIQSSLDRFNLNADPEQALAYLITIGKQSYFVNPLKTTQFVQKPTKISKIS
uniref:Uncharacterized protein n=1 Tax=Acrobeloides nanus TaxID=290746 RepID=A0A914CHZ5_9BILA